MALPGNETARIYLGDATWVIHFSLGSDCSYRIAGLGNAHPHPNEWRKFEV